MYLNFSKFLCVSEYEGNLVFGPPSPSKKRAKQSCAICLLDNLIKSKKIFQYINVDGTRVKTPKAELQTPKRIESINDFANDVDFDEVCYILT